MVLSIGFSGFTIGFNGFINWFSGFSGLNGLDTLMGPIEMSNHKAHTYVALF